MKNILGDRMDLREAFSLELAVTKDTVPLFIWHTVDLCAIFYIKKRKEYVWDREREKRQ